MCHCVPFPRATKEIGDVCTQAICAQRYLICKQPLGIASSAIIIDGKYKEKIMHFMAFNPALCFPQAEQCCPADLLLIFIIIIIL